jgi:hypothetical protein
MLYWHKITLKTPCSCLAAMGSLSQEKGHFVAPFVTLYPQVGRKMERTFVCEKQSWDSSKN